MAFLKDLIVGGSARVLGKLYASEFVGNASSATNASTAVYATNAGTATRATGDSAGNNINTTYIKSATISGKVITFTKGNGSTFSITTQDNNTTYANYKGATTAAAGTAGLVPSASTANRLKFLRGDGTWVTPNNTTYAAVSTASNGLCPKRNGSTHSYLRGDGTWTSVTVSSASESDLDFGDLDG